MESKSLITTTVYWNIKACIIPCAQDPEKGGMKTSERTSREENEGRRNEWFVKGCTQQRDQRKEAQKN